MKHFLLLFVTFLVVTESYAGKWDNYKTGYYTRLYSVSEDGNMYCSLTKENKSEEGDNIPPRMLAVYTDAVADIHVELTGDSRFQLTNAPTATETYSTYARAYVYYTFDVTGLQPSAAPYSATITITRGDQVVTCTVSETYVEEPAPTTGPMLDGKFSVDAKQKVKFTRGNLYWNGTDWAMESAQERVKSLWRTDHIGLLCWGDNVAKAIETGYDYSSEQLFCDGSDDAHMLTIEDAKGLYAMSMEQWDYLLFKRKNASRLYRYPVSVNGVYGCMVIAPDDYEGSIEDYYSDFLTPQRDGLVCLPPPGSRYGTSVFSGSFQYWTSTRNKDGWASAFYMHNTSENTIEIDASNITYCYGIRLVQNVASSPVNPDGDDDEPDEDPEIVNYFWMENLTDDATTLNVFANIEYTLTPDNESSWVDISNTSIDVNGREKVYLRATPAGNTNMRRNIIWGSAGMIYDNEGWHDFDNHVNYRVGGDITTLLDARGNVKVLPEAEYHNTYTDEYWGVFQMFFYDDPYLQDVSELVLPSTTLSKNCYMEMFKGCTSITTAPVLPAYELVEGCYNEMFLGCTNLNHVKAYFTDWNREGSYYNAEYNSTRNWLDGVAFEGVFEKFDFMYCNGDKPKSSIPASWSDEMITSVDIKVPAVGYTTYYYPGCWQIPAGMEGYVAYMDYDHNYHFEKAYEAGNYVMGRALVLKAKPGTYTIKFYSDGYDEYTGLNDLCGSVTTVDLCTYDFSHYDYYWYALSTNAENDPASAGLYWMKEDGSTFTSAPFEAWLSIHKRHFNAEAQPVYLFNPSADEDGIMNIAAKELETTAIYDLSGRRVNNTNQKGFYIINGKKTVK